ncbi:hypothetical protein D1007_12726 [Hordeum vulgare]|nr:hypothetical protein D1007_12726 [Hordeum vulgare]
MEALESLFVTVEVSHAPNPQLDLVAGHVTPDVVQPSFAPPRKWLGSVIVQGGLFIARVWQAGVPATVAGTGRCNSGEAGPERQGLGCEVQEGGCKSNPANASFGCTVESNPEDSRRRLCYRRVQRVRRNGDGLHNTTVEFVHLLDDNAVDIDQNELDGGEEIAQEKYRDMEASCGSSFNLEHCWKLLQPNQKWELIKKESPSKRGSLTEMDDDDDEDDDGPRNEDKPDGNKKAKDKIKRESVA